jgi:hypothetical protein
MYQEKSLSYDCNLHITKTGIAQNESVVQGTHKNHLYRYPTVL